MLSREFLIVLGSGGIVVIAYWLYTKQQQRKHSLSIRRYPSNGIGTYNHMRNKAFDVTPDSIGLTRATYSGAVWGIIIEIGLSAGRTQTLVLFAEGTTSLYQSNGLGFIGAGGHEHIRTMSQDCLSLAESVHNNATPIDSISLPLDGEVRFYFRGFGSLKMLAEKQSELARGSSKYSELANMALAVIAEIRKTVATVIPLS